MDMDDLPSLSFPTPWHEGQRVKPPSSSKGRVRVSGEERELYTDEEGEDSEGDTVIFDQLGAVKGGIDERSTFQSDLMRMAGHSVKVRECGCL